MVEKHAEVIWRGDLRRGQGLVTPESGTFQQAPITYARRFEREPGTSPEELIAAAHAGCFSEERVNRKDAKAQRVCQGLRGLNREERQERKEGRQKLRDLCASFAPLRLRGVS